MITYLSTQAHQYTIQWFLADWGRALTPLLSPRHYEQFIQPQPQPLTEIYIFSDLERVNAQGLHILGKAWDQLLKRQPPLILLNNPHRFHKRLELLQYLYQQGINTFTAYPLNPEALPENLHFPVFLREANDHEGPRSDLLLTPTDLAQAIAEWKAQGSPGHTPIITEFIDTRDAQGRYQKYGAFRIGDTIVPAHIQTSDHWMVKASSSEPTEELIAQEWEYIQTNPHQAELMNIFKMAHVDYGRIDYTLVEGRIQVFEINSNPTLLKPGAPKNPQRATRKAYVAQQLVSAFQALATFITSE